MPFANQALRMYLERFTDGREILEKILATSRSPELLPWAIDGGQAVHAILTKQKDLIQTLLPLAEKLRLANG